MRQAWAIWLKLIVREADIRLNKVRKAHDNAITNLHKGVLRGIGQQKIKRSMKLLLKDMAGLKGTPIPKRGLIAWVPNAKWS